MRDQRQESHDRSQLQLLREGWSTEGWHWIRDTQLHKDAHAYSNTGAGAIAMLRTAALAEDSCATFSSVTGRAHRAWGVLLLLVMPEKPITTGGGIGRSCWAVASRKATRMVISRM